MAAVLNILPVMFPLQIRVEDFAWGNGGSVSNPKQIIIFLVIVAAGIGIIFIVNAVKNKSSGTARSGGGKTGLFSGFALHRMARDIGLNHDQIKMLDFVFKTDEVTDPEKSINTTSLLDRHFKRAYRVIEQSSNADAEAQHRLAVLFSTRNMLEHNVSGRITSTRQLKDDTTLVISNGKEKYNTALISTKGDQLVVGCPKNAIGSPIKFQKGARLSVLLFTKDNKGFSFETHVIGYSNTHGGTALLLAHSNQLKFLSHRRYRRKQVFFDCNINPVYVEGSGKKQRMVVDKRRFTGNIADISVGGCSIKTKAPLQIGGKLKIEFTNDENNVAALGQVLRTNRTNTGVIVHTKFLRVSRKSMNIINAFVYEYGHE